MGRAKNFLQQFYKLIIPDIPGSGLSVFNESLDSIEAYSVCIHAVLQNENIQTCCMLGHSMGGYITLAFAEKYAGELKRIRMDTFHCICRQ